MIKIGRNKPCPCGSGKKYKHCCQGLASVVNDELSGLLAGQDVNSLEEAQALTDAFVQQKNQQADDDFQGLSPEQMHRALYFAFDSPDVFQFSDLVPRDAAAPVLTLAGYIVNAIEEKGLKLTAKGNLPQKLCKEAASEYWQDLPLDDIHHRIKVNKEEDFFDLHVTRLLLQLSGFLRKSKGRLFITKKCRQLIEDNGVPGLYPVLLQYYCQQFNWSYRDGYDELAFIQQSSLFSIYLLQRYGDEWKPFGFYEDCFIQAFPMLLDEVESSPYCSSDERVRRCYSLRTLENYLQYFGLAEVEKEKMAGEKPFSYNRRIRVQPLLDKAVQFMF